MNVLLFSILRTLRGDVFLQNFSCPQEEIMSEIDGISVAIVGNARSLSKKAYGPAIDKCDLVVRMHAAPLPSAKSHGSKTNWLALGMPVSQQIIMDRAPQRLLWMAKKRKRVRQRLVKHDGFYLHPVEDWNRMAAQLSAPPTTGALIIDLVTRSNASEIQLFGFDFFSSLSLSGGRTAKQVPHDFQAEKKFVESLIAQDSRVVLNR